MGEGREGDGLFAVAGEVGEDEFEAVGGCGVAGGGEVEGVALANEVVGDVSVAGGCVVDADAWGVEPFGFESESEEEGVVGFVFGDEDGAGGVDEAGADPGVGHVAYEAGCAVVAVGDLGPVEPSGGELVLCEPVEHGVGALAVSGAEHGGDDAEFVGGVVEPIAVVGDAEGKVVPVALEGVGEELLGEVFGEFADGDGDGGGGRVEVAEFDAAGDEVDALLFGGHLDGADEGGFVVIGELLEVIGVVVEAELSGDGCGVVESADDEDVVPVAVHGFFGVAFVADGFGDESFVCGADVLGGESLVAEVFHVGDASADVVVVLAGEVFIVGVFEEESGEVDELSGGVVFVDGVGSAVVDDAGDFAVVVLIGCVPGEVVGDGVGLAHVDEGFAGECAIADPGALVGS